MKILLLLPGVNMGLYAHELMQNCEKLLKSTSAKVTNVKELLQQSAAMTQSIGSARVLVAHVSSQVSLYGLVYCF